MGSREALRCLADLDGPPTTRTRTRTRASARAHTHQQCPSANAGPGSSPPPQPTHPCRMRLSPALRPPPALSHPVAGAPARPSLGPPPGPPPPRPPSPLLVAGRCAEPLRLSSLSSPLSASEATKSKALRRLLSSRRRCAESHARGRTGWARGQTRRPV
jgi:hypothetical protein